MPRKNPLKLDPSRTATLRRAFMQQMTKRFNELKRRIKQLVVADDTFGLTVNANPEGHNQYWNPDGPYKRIAELGVPLEFDEGGISFYDPTTRGITVARSRHELSDALHELGHYHLKHGGSPSMMSETEAWRWAVKNHRRFGVSKRKLFQAIRSSEVALRLKRGTLFPVTNAGMWSFMTSDRKLEEFKKWLMLQIGDTIYKTEAYSPFSWLENYIQQGYKKGLERSWTDAKRPTGIIPLDKKTGEAYRAGGKAEFMRKSFGGPVSVGRVKLLAQRAYTDLESVTDQMSGSIAKTLMDGMIAGNSPREVGEQLNKIIDGSKNRGAAIARTETIRAHAEGALDGFKELGITQIKAAVEWSTAADEKVCPKCKPLDGVVLTVDEAHGLIPRHPNCRCAWVPANVGEKTEGQKRSYAMIQASITASLQKDVPKKVTKTQLAKRGSSWPGANAKISRSRPVPFKM